MHSAAEVHPLYGLMAEFETPGQLVAAARKTREAGFRNFDAYSPYPIHELDDAMDLHDNRVSTCTFIGGVLGAIGGFRLLCCGLLSSWPPHFRRPPPHLRLPCLP